MGLGFILTFLYKRYTNVQHASSGKWESMRCNLTYYNGDQENRTPSVGKVVEKLEPSYMAGGVKNDTLLWKTACQFLKLVNTGLSCNPAISLLVLHPRELKTHVHTNTCAEMFIVY